MAACVYRAVKISFPSEHKIMKSNIILAFIAITMSPYRQKYRHVFFMHYSECTSLHSDPIQYQIAKTKDLSPKMKKKMHDDESLLYKKGKQLDTKSWRPLR